MPPAPSEERTAEKLILSFFLEQLQGSLADKHSDSSFLVDDARIHQQIDALEGGSGIDFIAGGKLGDGRNLLPFTVDTGQNLILQSLR